MTTASSLEATAAAEYADAKALADNAIIEVDQRINEAVSALSGIPTAASGSIITVADVVVTPITKPILPTADFSTEVRQAFDYAFGTFNQTLQSQILNFLDAFFPDIAAGVKTGSDQWIIDTIANGRFVPIAVETALWNRAKDREVIEAARIEQEIIDASASRGFSAPPGTVNYTIAVTQQESEKNRATLNREIAIKAFDTANENTKFAIQQAVSLRTAFVAAMGDFIKVSMVQPNNATEYAKTILASKTGLYDSAIRLYSAQIDEERMSTGVAIENNRQFIQAATVTADNQNRSVTANVNKAQAQADASMKAADTLAHIAGASLATKNNVTSVAAAV